MANIGASLGGTFLGAPGNTVPATYANSGEVAEEEPDPESSSNMRAAIRNNPPAIYVRDDEGAWALETPDGDITIQLDWIHLAGNLWVSRDAVPPNHWTDDAGDWTSYTAFTGADWTGLSPGFTPIVGRVYGNGTVLFAWGTAFDFVGDPGGVTRDVFALISADAGATWTTTINGSFATARTAAGVTSYTVFAFSTPCVTSASSIWMTAGADGGGYVMHWNGTLWSAVLPDADAIQLYNVYEDALHVYVSGFETGAAVVYHSTDGGGTWATETLASGDATDIAYGITGSSFDNVWTFLQIDSAVYVKKSTGNGTWTTDMPTFDQANEAFSSYAITVTPADIFLGVVNYDVAEVYVWRKNYVADVWTKELTVTGTDDDILLTGTTA